MLHKLYTLFIAPTQENEDDRNRELVLNVLLSSTLVLLLLSLPIFIYNIFVLSKDFAPGRMLWVFVLLSFVGGLYYLSRTGRYRIAALLLVTVYFLLACLVVGEWGVTTPTGIMLFGLVIVLSGIMLGPRYGLYTAGAVIASLVLIHIATTYGAITPDLSWTVDKPEIGDVIAFSLIYCILAVVSWLYNYQMERSLHRAELAERALQRQKESLEETVTERTEQLQAEQLEKIQQMYRFAELGQLSTALLHELADHLTTITLDIEGLDKKQSSVLGRAKQSIHYIDDMVRRVRDQLHGKPQSQTFNVVNELGHVVKILQHKATQENVGIRWRPPADKKGWRIRGDSLRFRQLLANLISNGIEAYHGFGTGPDRAVAITLETRGKKDLVIHIADWGKGIPEPDRAKLFEPLYSTKKTGLGMGLYIAHQITEAHLHGKLNLEKSKDHTSFEITLPRIGS